MLLNETQQIKIQFVVLDSYRHHVFDFTSELESLGADSSLSFFVASSSSSSPGFSSFPYKVG